MGSLKVLDVIPSPAEDSEKLKKAFQGLGTDEDGIIGILGHRDASQRKKIRETYQQLYNENLIDVLNSELSGDFGKAVILWTYDPSERDARLANEALKSEKKGVKQLEIVVEMSCASSPQHLVAVRQAYCSLFDCSLEEDIVASVSMPLKKILLGLVTAYRYDKELVDMDVANLRPIGYMRLSKPRSWFMMMFCTYSLQEISINSGQHLKATRKNMEILLTRFCFHL
ncbi:hypothetical protein CRYUN_Cryun05aG0121500 [Craigia yunnanensis]